MKTTPASTRNIRAFVVALFVFIIMQALCNRPSGRDRDGCWVHVATVHRAIVGRVSIIDTLVDRSGVGFYIKNSDLKESYDCYSQDLVSCYRRGEIGIGDTIVKDSGTRVGYVRRPGKEDLYIELLTYRPECDDLPIDQQRDMMRTYPHDFRY